MNRPMPEEISQAMARYQPSSRAVLEVVRDLVFEAADEHPQIGPVSETLKWGEPSYLTPVTKAGSTLRLSQTRKDEKPALFVNCKTDLIAQFRTLYPDTFMYDGVRALIVDGPPEMVREELKHCIALTLTYLLRRK